MSSSSTPDRASSARGYRLLVLALLLTALAFLATLKFAFVYDVSPQIVLNKSLETWKSLPNFFLKHSWHFLLPDWAGNYYRPVFMSWLLVNRMIFGVQPAYWHATTVLLHLLATFLAFVVASQLFHDRTKAGFVALLFGLHPIHIESVAWVSGVTDPLLAVFAFASVWAWIRGERSGGAKWPWQILSVILYAAGCLSKEAGVLLPIMIVAYDLLFGTEDRKWTGFVHSILRCWPLWLTGVAYLVARKLALRGFYHPLTNPFSELLLTIPTILWGYMRRLVWPTNLSVFYDTPPVTSALQWRFWLPLLAWILVGVLAWRIAKRSRITAFSLIWIFVFLAPAIMGLPVFPVGEWIHDRYLYLPSFGFCVLVVHAITQLPSRRQLFGYPAAPAAAMVAITAVMAFQTSWQEQYWREGVLLFTHTVKIAPNSSSSKVHLATELLRVGQRDRANLLFEEALKLEPDNWKNNVAYGFFLYYGGEYAAAEQRYLHAISVDDTDSNIYFYLGLARFNLGDFPGAEQAFRGAMARNSGWMRHHFWLGFSLERQGKIEQARQQFEEELRLHPDTDTPAREHLQAISKEVGK